MGNVALNEKGPTTNKDDRSNGVGNTGFEPVTPALSRQILNILNRTPKNRKTTNNPTNKDKLTQYSNHVLVC